MKADKRERFLYLDILRLLAMLDVISVHTGTYQIIEHFGVEMFIVISGALWLTKEKISMKDVYRKGIIRIFLSFSAWSLFYSILHNVIFPLYAGDTVSFKRVFIAFAEGRYHLWFCYMIIGLYMAIPLFIKIVESEALVKYALMIMAVFSIIVPSIQNVPEFMWTSVVITGCINWNWAYYPFFFLLGFYLQKAMMNKWEKAAIYIVGFISAVLSWNGTTYFSKMFKVSLIVFLFSVTRKLCKNSYSGKKQTIIATLSKLSFGVYLAHDFMITVFDLIPVNWWEFYAVARYAFVVLASFAVMYIWSLLCQKLKNINKRKHRMEDSYV